MLTHMARNSHRIAQASSIGHLVSFPTGIGLQAKMHTPNHLVKRTAFSCIPALRSALLQEPRRFWHPTLGTQLQTTVPLPEARFTLSDHLTLGDSHRYLGRSSWRTLLTQS